MIPFTYSQDTAGPFARNVQDAAVLLGAMTGVDESDPATYRSVDRSVEDYSVYLDSDGLKNARIGVFLDADEEYINSDEYDEELYQNVIDVLKNEGAEVIEDIEIPSYHKEWSYNVSLYELKHSLDNYLSKLPNQIPVHSIQDMIEFNKLHSEKALKYGQDKLENRAKLSNTLRESEYLLAKIEDLYYSQEQGIDAVLNKYNLNAILFPSYVGSTICAKAGYPSIALPAGYSKNGRPFGITFASGAFNEGMLIKIGYAYEQATKLRKKPILK
ncbi:Amidase OS=Ureibacillus acetophenoni OX=614649 GN=SAMN05877842_12126 PE=4 SV=1 [Ureibacillus acetophenoni]